MLKRIIGQHLAEQRWLDVEGLTQVEVTSEDPTHPIESGLLAASASGWRAAHAGPQRVRLLFDQPQPIKRIYLKFREEELARTPMVSNRGQSHREIVHQHREIYASNRHRAHTAGFDCDRHGAQQHRAVVRSTA